VGFWKFGQLSLGRFAPLVVALALPFAAGCSRSHEQVSSPTSDSGARTNSVSKTRIVNGVRVTFATSTDAGTFEAIKRRLVQANIDDISLGQPASPAYCLPGESFSIAFDFGTERYRGGGWAPMGSGVPIRVVEYGEDQRSVYVVARAYDAHIASMHITLTHPRLAGVMTPLGDRWYVFAAAIGTEAPWYTQGTITAVRADRTTVTMSVPEGTDRLTRC
jgi:hypothetical protein